MKILDELKRRNVFRVGIAYAITAWLLLQLTEVLTELLNVLVRVSALQVARELGVNHILEGSVRKAGKRPDRHQEYLEPGQRLLQHAAIAAFQAGAEGAQFAGALRGTWLAGPVPAGGRCGFRLRVKMGSE